MKVGTKTVTGLKLGTGNITRAYLGDTLVWEAGGDPGAAFPVVEATNTSHVDSLTSNHPVALPAGITSGDLLIACLQAAASSWNTPTGWTLLEGIDNLGHGAIFTRTANGTEGATAAFTTVGNSRSAHNTYRVSNHAGIAALMTDNGANDPPELTAAWGGAKNLWIALLGHRASSVVANAAPTNYLDLLVAANASSALTSRCGIATARRLHEAASEDPGAFGLSSPSPPSAWRPKAATIVVRGA